MSATSTPQEEDTNLAELLKESLVLILVLVFTTVWVLYIIYYNSRVFGILVTAILNKFHRHAHIHIGSISVSVLSGKLMFRDVAYITDDYSARIQDGYAIFRWWRIYKPTTNEEDSSQVSTRLNILLNGFELHCYNRSTLYANLEHLFGLSVENMADDPSNNDCSTSDLDSTKQERLWRDLFGMIKIDIFTGHIIFGNQLVPTVLRIGAEETHIVYTTKAASVPHDEFSHDIKCKGEGLKVMFSPSPKFDGEQVDPPRFMGEGFVVLQSNNFDVHYFFDEPGYVKEGQEDEPPPAWAMHLTCGKATTISYGPWADRQRDFLQKLFYPADYKLQEKTPPLNVGDKRRPASFDFCLNMLDENTMDILFTTDSETDAIHISAGKGSYLETSIPMTVGDDGYKMEVKGQFFNVEATTSLAFSRLIETETLEYSVVVEHPLVWNHHQNWNINLDCSHTLVHLIYQHKVFLTDLIHDWSSKGVQDLMSFVPYTMHINFTLNKFELNLMCNEYNWMDCSSPHLNNTCIAFNGEQMDISLVLPFSDFLPVVVPVKVIFKIGPVTGYLYIPESFSNYHTLLGIDQATKSHVKWPVPRPDWYSITNKPGWIECASVPYLGLSIIYSYHPVPPSECVPLLKISDCKNGKPSITVTKIGNKLHSVNRRQPRWREVVEPGNLPADNMCLELDIGPAVLVAYGSILKAVLALKENYLGVDIDYMDLGRPLETQPIQKPLDKPEERTVNPLSLRPLQVTFALTVHTLQAYLPTHLCNQTNECLVLNMDRLVVEVHKAYFQTRLQVLLSPLSLHIADHSKDVGLDVPDCPSNKNGFCLSGLQLRAHAMFSDEGLPPEVDTVEYAWLVELQLGLLSGQLSPTQALAVASFAETFIMLVTDSENTLEKPIRDIKCVHQVIQSACRVKEKVYPLPCPSEDVLKYRMTRVWLEGFHICMKEEDSVLALQTSSVQVSTCNLHSEAVEAGLSCHIDLVELKLFMSQADISTPLLQVGELKLGPVNLDSADLSTNTTNCKAQQSFLRLHDRRTRRLWFLWPPLSLNFNMCCGCLGGCTFFGNGKSNKFLLHGKKYASNPSNRECLAYGQSLLKNEENVLQSNESRGQSPTKDFFFTQGFLSPGSTPCSPFSALSPEPTAIEDDQSSCQSSEKTIQPEMLGSDITSIRSDGTDSQQPNPALGFVGSSLSLPTTSMPLPKYQHARHHSDFVMRTMTEAERMQSPSEIDETDMPALESQTLWSQSSTSLSEYYSADEDTHPSASLLRTDGQNLVDEFLAYEFDVSLSEESSKRNSVIQKPDNVEVESNISSGSFKSATSAANTIANEDMNDQPSVIDLHEQASVMAAYTHHLSHVNYELLSPVAPCSSIDSTLSTMRTPGPPQPSFNIIQHGFSAGFMQLKDTTSGEQSLSSSVSDIISELSASTPTATPLKTFVDELNSSNNVEDVTSESSATTTNQGNRVIIRVGGPLEVFLSPLMLPAMQKLVAVLLPIVSNLSPPLVLDHLHSSCLSQVENTVDKSKEEETSHTQLTVNLKQVNVCLLQVGSWFKPGDVEIPVPVHSLLALCGYNFNVGLTTGNGIIGQLSAQRLHAQLRLLPVGSRKDGNGAGVTSIPDTHSKVMFFCKRDQDLREYGWIMAELGLEVLNIKGGLPEKKSVKKEKVEVTPVPNRSSNSSTPDAVHHEQMPLVTVSFGGIWTAVPAPKKTAVGEDHDKVFLANLLNTATPALDAWLIPADHFSSMLKCISTSFHTRKCAILVSLMTMAHENEEWKKRNEKSYPHLSKRSHTIQEDLSCQLLVLLLRYIQSSKIELEDQLKPDVLPAATTLDKGVHVLLRQWRMNLSLVNPMAATRWQVMAMSPAHTADKMPLETDPQYMDNLQKDATLTEGDGAQEHFDETSSLSQSYQYTQMKGSQVDLYQEFAEPRQSRTANVRQMDSYSRIRSQTDGSTATDNSYLSTDPYISHRSKMLEERRARPSSPTSTTPLDAGMEDGDLELGTLNRTDLGGMRSKLKTKLPITPTTPMLGEADTMFYPLLDNLGVPGEQQLGQPSTVLQNLGAMSAILEVNSARVYVIDDKPRKTTSRKRSNRHNKDKAINYQKVEGEILVLDCQKFRVDCMGKLSSKDDNSSRAAGEEKHNQHKLIDIQLAVRLGKIQLMVNMPLLRFVVHLVSMVKNFKSTRTNLKLARYTSNAPADTTEMLLREGQSNEMDDTDDVYGSRFWEADSDTEPRCWQTMYHLIDLYSGMSDQMVRGHLTINPLFNIENEDVQTSEDDEVDSPQETQKEDEELPGYYAIFVNTNHVILTTTAVIDNVQLQAKLGGLQLESEIIQLYGSVTHEREQRPITGQAIMENVQKISSTAHFDLLNVHLLERSSRLRQVVLATSLNKSHMLLTDENHHLIGTIMLGEFNMELPQNPATLHEMATRSTRRLTDQATELSRPLKSFRSEETLSQIDIDETDHPGLVRQKKPVTMNLMLKGICMQAMLLPSLRAQYKLKDATGNMNMHEEVHMTVHMPNHAISFISQVEAAEESFSSASIDLPTIEFLADMKRRDEDEVQQSARFYLMASINIGSFNHTISTDLLNHLVFVQKVFIKEVNEIMQKLVGDDNTASSQESLVIPKSTSLLPFTLILKQQGIQVTAQTPSTSAVQFETNAIQFEITNLPPSDSQNTESVDTRQIFLKTNVELTLSVGDMIRNALFEEAQPEFTQLAFFKTKIKIINTPESKASSTSNNGVVLVTLQRPVFYMPPQAVDKAVLVWLNYKNAYDHWHEQRQALSKEVWLATQQVMSRIPKPQIPVPAATTAPSTGVFLQVSVQNLGLCVPTTLIQRGNESHTSVSQEPESQQALVLTLDESLISAHYCGALVSEGQFSNFCLRFADDFGMSMDDWKKQEMEIANSCIVPKGSYKVCSKTFNSGHSAVGSAGKWELSFKWEMQGMDIKIYPNIGHHLSVFGNTMTALTGDPADSDIADLSTVMSEPEEQNESKQLSSDSELSDVCPVNTSNLEPVEPTNLKVVFRKARDKHSQESKDSKRRSKVMIDKMREQAKVVNDLRNLGAKSGTIKEEAKQLEKLEEAVFKEFRKDVRRKLRKGGGTKGNTWKDHLIPGLIPLPRGHTQVDARPARRTRSKSVMSPTSYQRPSYFTTPVELTPSRSHVPRVVFDLPTPDRESFMEISYPQTEPRPQRLIRQPMVDDSLNVTIGDPRQVASELLQHSRYLWPLTRNRHFSETSDSDESSSDDESVINLSHPPPPKRAAKTQRSNEDSSVGASPSHTVKPEQTVDMALDVIITTDSGWLEIFAKNPKLDETDDCTKLGSHSSVNRKASLPTQTGVPERPLLGSYMSVPGLGQRHRSLTQAQAQQNISTMLFVPGIDAKVNYNSQLEAVDNEDGHDKKAQKKASLHCKIVFQAAPKEIVLSPILLDFIEKTLEEVYQHTTKPAGSIDESLNSGVELEPSNTSLVSSSTSGYSTFPVEVVVYLCIKPSTIRFSCLPISRVQCLLQLPSVELAFSSSRHVASISKDTDGPDVSNTVPQTSHQSELIKGGLNVSACLSDFSLFVFHPYGGQQRVDSSFVTLHESREFEAGNRRDSLSVKVEFVRVNLSRKRRAYVSPTSDVTDASSSPAVVTEHLRSTSPAPSSRTSTSSGSPSSIKFSILCDVGSASLNYDIRRLTEVLAFPKAWYRKSIARQLFFGKESTTQLPTKQPSECDSSDSSSPKLGGSLENLATGARQTMFPLKPPSWRTPGFSPTSPGVFNLYSQLGRGTPLRQAFLHRHSDGTPAELIAHRDQQRPTSTPLPSKEKEAKQLVWDTRVVIGINLSKLEVNMNMSNVMGTSVWLVKGLQKQVWIALDSTGCKDVRLVLDLEQSSIDSHGGVIGGRLEMTKFHSTGHIMEQPGKEPSHTVSAKLDDLSVSVDYMGGSTLLCQLTEVDLEMKDEWRLNLTEPAQASITTRPASIFVHIDFKWDTVQMMITRSTTPDLIKIINKLTEFISQQFHSSKMALASFGSQILTKPIIATQKPPPPTQVIQNHHRHWQPVSGFLTECSNWVFGEKIVPELGTVLGGQVKLSGNNVLLACFGGINFRAKSWALFALREPTIHFDVESMKLQENAQECDTLTLQDLQFYLGHNQVQRSSNGTMASIYRITASERSNYPTTGSSIQQCFQYICSITMHEDLRPFLQAIPSVQGHVRYKHEAVPIFCLPKLHLQMKSKHQQGTNIPTDLKPMVDVTFITQFDDHIHMAMDIELVIFLHDLVSSYIDKKDKDLSKTTPLAPDKKLADMTPSRGEEDWRVFQCTTWQLEPTVRLLSLGGQEIEALGADYILNKLGFKHARTTIPKWFQRGAMDPMNKILALLVHNLLQAMRREEKLE